jgi:hypothetical protein
VSVTRPKFALICCPAGLKLAAVLMFDHCVEVRRTGQEVWPAEIVAAQAIDREGRGAAALAIDPASSTFTV